MLAKRGNRPTSKSRAVHSPSPSGSREVSGKKRSFGQKRPEKQSKLPPQLPQGSPGLGGDSYWVWVLLFRAGGTGLPGANGPIGWQPENIAHFILLP